MVPYRETKNVIYLKISETEWNVGLTGGSTTYTV